VAIDCRSAAIPRQRRQGSISAGRREEFDIERAMDDDPRWTPPWWYTTLESLRANPGRLLFR
jgi:hypothetical protein